MRRRFAILAAALGGAFVAQHWLTPLTSSRVFAELPKGRAAVGFAGLLIAGMVAAAVVWRDDEPQEEPSPPASEPVLAWRSRVVNAVVVLVLLATAVAYLDVLSPWAIYPWAAGIGSLTVAAVYDAFGPYARRRPMSRSDWLALFSVLALAVLWRYPELSEVPARVHGDEAACGLEARRILHGEVPNLLGLGWYDIPYPSFALSALSMAAFGDDLFGLRMASVFFGVGSIAFAYLVVRRMFGTRVALLTGVLAAVSHWHVHFSRIGTDYMQASFATMAALYFFVRARQEQRWGNWVLAGLAVGLSFSVYFAGRVVAVIFVLLLAIERLVDPARAARFTTGSAALLLAAGLFFAPIYAVSARQPTTLAGRPSGVFVLSPRNCDHTLSTTGTTGLPGLLAVQSARSLAAFNWRGERSEQHEHAAPLLDFWTGAVFAVGAVAFTAVGWRRRYRIVVLWFWTNLTLGSILTVDAMFSPRMIAALPLLFVFPALLLDKLASLAERGWGVPGRRWATCGLVLLLLAGSAANFRDYFDLHENRLQPPRQPTILSRFVERWNDDYRLFVYGRFSLHYDTPRFLVPTVDGAYMGESRTSLPDDQDDLGGGAKGVGFVVDSEWHGRPMVEEAVVATYANCERRTLRLASGSPAFETLLCRPR